MRAGRAAQGGLRGGFRGGAREGAPDGLGTKGLRRGTAISSKRTTSNVVGKKSGGDKGQVNGEVISNRCAAKGA